MPSLYQKEGEEVRGELTGAGAITIIAKGLAAVEVLGLEVEEASVADNPILRYFNNAALGVKACV